MSKKDCVFCIKKVILCMNAFTGAGSFDFKCNHNGLNDTFYIKISKIKMSISLFSCCILFSLLIKMAQTYFACVKTLHRTTLYFVSFLITVSSAALFCTLSNIFHIKNYQYMYLNLANLNRNVNGWKEIITVSACKKLKLLELIFCFELLAMIIFGIYFIYSTSFEILQSSGSLSLTTLYLYFPNTSDWMMNAIFIKAIFSRYYDNMKFWLEVRRNKQIKDVTQKLVDFQKYYFYLMCTLLEIEKCLRFQAIIATIVIIICQILQGMEALECFYFGI